jgi:predicted DsbA family dithiol-disulfide isomerase
MLAIANQIGLNERAFSACLAGTMRGRVKEDSDSAAILGIRVTPTFLIGRIQSPHQVVVTHAMSGAKKINDFARALDALLAGTN